ncbi:hypothetical protein GCM10009544_18410 [Streptomyces stramineus]|uniref:Uncharacterized protein n=1 Tax=Streptomyces stramineus TaxID=173861 RepID=A0ABN0ZQU9_9ACTN
MVQSSAKAEVSRPRFVGMANLFDPLRAGGGERKAPSLWGPSSCRLEDIPGRISRTYGADHSCEAPSPDRRCGFGVAQVGIDLVL